MQIRPIQESDATRVAELATQLGYRPSAQMVAPNIHAILANPAHQAFVYLNDDGEIIGWIHVFMALRLALLPFAEISGMVVDANAQDQGVGRALVTHCKHWARSRGANQLRVRCDTAREQAKGFYQHLGFQIRKDQHVFAREI